MQRLKVREYEAPKWDMGIVCQLELVHICWIFRVVKGLFFIWFIAYFCFPLAVPITELNMFTTWTFTPDNATMVRSIAR